MSTEEKKPRSLPEGVETVGPIPVTSALKKSFVQVCDDEGKTIAAKITELMTSAVK